MSSNYFFNRHPRAAIFLIAASVLLLPFAIEGLLFYSLHHPSFARHSAYLLRAVTHLYYMHELDIIQFQPQCARFDDELFYAMKPGDCRHRSVEFDCVYSFNSMGLRDDEASLNKPEIIMLGDSYTMGWGMDNEKIYPSLVERATGMKTLNVSVSSYGTAREFIFLRKLDLSNLKYLVIQYCTNDFDENRQYIDDGFNLKIQSREFYETTVQNHVSRVKYRPFLYMSTLIKAVWGRIDGSHLTKPQIAKASVSKVFSKNSEKKAASENATPEDSVRYFLEIAGSMPNLAGVQIIVMNISGPVYTTPSFIRTLSKMKNDASYPEFVRTMKLIDVCDHVKTEDYFILDCHLNEKGHRKVADAVLQAMN